MNNRFFTCISINVRTFQYRTRHFAGILTLGLTLIVVAARPQQVSAGMITYDLGTVVAGSSAVGTAPWVSATFTDVNSTTVTLTVVANAQLIGSIHDIYFNYNPSPSLAGLGIVASSLGSPLRTSNAILWAQNSQGPGSGFNSTATQFDVGIHFPPPPDSVTNPAPSQEFVAGTTNVFTLTNAGGLSISDFAFTNALGTNQSVIFAAVIQQPAMGTIAPPDGQHDVSLVGNAGVNPNADVSAPEPASMCLLAFGAAAMGAYGWRKRRKSLASAG
jgi:hypothetical protein